MSDHVAREATSQVENEGVGPSLREVEGSSSVLRGRANPGSKVCWVGLSIVPSLTQLAQQGQDALLQGALSQKSANGGVESGPWQLLCNLGREPHRFSQQA